LELKGGKKKKKKRKRKRKKAATALKKAISHMRRFLSSSFAAENSIWTPEMTRGKGGVGERKKEKKKKKDKKEQKRNRKQRKQQQPVHTSRTNRLLVRETLQLSLQLITTQPLSPENQF
jgi:hypothetical protein